MAARYGTAVLAVAVALVIRLALHPVLGYSLPFLLFCLAVIAAAWYGGFGPSFLALILGILASLYFFCEPPYALAESLPRYRFHVVGFLFLGVTIGTFSEALRAARRRAEAHAREADRRREDLEDEVSERVKLEEKLQQHAEELAEADRRKDEFLAMLGHELRNPLAPIRNAVEVMRSLELDDRLIGVRDAIDRQVAQLTRLVDDLLDVSRISRGMITLKREEVELAGIIVRAVETSQPLFDAKRQHLIVDLATEPVWLDGDVARLAQVFANLLNNASKYTPAGGQIRLRARAEGGEIVIRVTDNGLGITAEMLPRIFDLFAQADRTLDRSEGGLGIGLTLVKALVELHGGRVEATSAGIGLGSEFVVCLPVLVTEPKRESSRTDGQTAPAGAARRVLAVDDNIDAVESLAQLLGLHGHEVRTAYDGPTAIATAADFRPEVILLDIGLPRMDGYEVARRLRQQPGLEQTFLVAVTGYAQEQDRRRAHAAGFDAHLVKPADVATLHQLLAGAPAHATH
jgi:signal transduction histidine kinase/ActR/RegA family two-component response regulator